MKILVAEDDVHILFGLSEVLEDEGYDVITAENGAEALSAYHEKKPDFILLDIMMPMMNGYDVCKQIRKHDEDIPIIFLSAKSEEIDKVMGLELGADDFISKPFGIQELTARIRSVYRRFRKTSESQSAGDDNFAFGHFQVSPKELRAKHGDTTVDLSLREVKVLLLLAQKKGQAVSRDELFDACWGINYAPNSRSLDQFISQLRKKIEEDPKKPLLIRTVHGVGYRYE